ncbi:pilus assembly PilX family protein [Pseudomonas sp. MBLB4136]|uniref:pilus assembly PilX family protein n=1 Tax=Pseudomonas sp. MBLB4136 TaxID=3451558 RepID=UPI003F754205
MNRPTPSLHIRSQQGAVLIIALVMLLLLTIIGLSSMRGTSLQESMAGNMRDNNVALQAAEAALRDGENIVNSKFLNGTLNTLEAAPQTGSYSSFPGVSSNPTYKITLLAKLRTSTEAGAAITDEGALVRVEADGYGVSTNLNSSATSRAQLSSTFLVEQ